MAINIELTDCVAFLGLKNIKTGKIDCGGTAFFLKHTLFPDEDEMFTSATIHGERSAVFAVTAKHNIDLARSGSSAEAVSLRLNSKNGGTIEHSIGFDDWLTLSSGSVDVAVARLEWEDEWDHKVLGSGFLLRESELDAVKHQFGVGEEVCVTGLFSAAPGTNRNQPIARFGHLVAVYSEVKSKIFPSPIRAHLAEIHSIGGLSGSPVFVKIQFDDTYHNKEHPRTISDPYWMLAGIVHGHFDVAEDGINDRERHVKKNYINTGIAVVVPAINVLETLDEALRNLKN
jgi:hypothetical protein